mgnify:CR=1 FL=1
MTNKLRQQLLYYQRLDTIYKSKFFPSTVKRLKLPNPFETAIDEIKEEIKKLDKGTT